MSLNAVLLDDEQRVLPLNSLERTLAIHDGVSFQLLSGSGFPGSSAIFSSPRGSVQLTNYRFIYLAEDQAAWFKSFSCTYNRLKSVSLNAPTWFSSHAQLQADVDPTEGEPHLKQISRMSLGLSDDGKALFDRLQSLLFTGPVDPEQFAEPLPRYQSPPPSYDQVESRSAQL